MLTWENIIRLIFCLLLFLLFCLTPTNNKFRVDCRIQEFTLPTPQVALHPTRHPTPSLSLRHHHRQLIPTHHAQHAPTTHRPLNVVTWVDPVAIHTPAPFQPEAAQVVTHTLHPEPDLMVLVTLLSASKCCEFWQPRLPNWRLFLFKNYLTNSKVCN